MSWSQVSDRRWERPTNGMEGYFTVAGSFSASLMEGRHHYTIFSRVSVDLPFASHAEATEALCHAWQQLRYEQPMIATTVEGMTKVYEVPDEAALNQWLEATFIVSPAADAGALMRIMKPIQQATLYYLPESSEIVFRCHHALMDGVGTLMLWHSFLSILASPQDAPSFGDEPARLAPTLEAILNHPEPPKPELAAQGAKLVQECVHAMPGVGPVNRVGTVAAGPVQTRELLFPERTSAALVEACKAQGFSVSAAVHAAYIRTVVAHADPAGPLSGGNANRYVTVNSVNLRPKLPEPFSTSQYAASLYYTPWSFVIDNIPDSFVDTARIVDHDYKTLFDADVNADNLEISGSLTRALRDIVQTPEFLAQPVARDALFSSLGIMERYVQRSYGTDGQKIAVKDVNIGVDVILGISMLFAYTFRDTLRLGYSFNEAYEDPETIQSHLEEMQKILVEELVA
ncbi:hypothetical protein BO78DRAFT_106130 [Aspergillus sclerotiicarbonarius CBS 121057]|uniref:Condensation domain-containing protein n=1 Tax=Aspergillus sclerotiicarbonarius (strain CBS 121057 / IBT 28362) TaxID=1448318 RepID=A0A319ET13_ASPSB|nr:hypothetical protein BO78DRAFT_106130 [Aspergillus sclerotiicarbonarius CBS 121057]